MRICYDCCFPIRKSFVKTLNSKEHHFAFQNKNTRAKDHTLHVWEIEEDIRWIILPHLFWCVMAILSIGKVGTGRKRVLGKYPSLECARSLHSLAAQLQSTPSVVWRLPFFTFFVARSRLYLSWILQINTHIAAFFEIEKFCTIYMSLRPFAPPQTQNLQTFAPFCHFGGEKWKKNYSDSTPNAAEISSTFVRFRWNFHRVLPELREISSWLISGYMSMNSANSIVILTKNCR
jgi:hypothetical protein